MHMRTRGRLHPRRSSAAVATTLALLAASCGGATLPAAPVEPAGVELLGAGAERAEPDRDAGGVRSLVAAQTAFAIDLYHTVRTEVAGDLVVAPASLHTLLAMIRAGAAGRTATEMDAVLHATDVPLHTAGNALARELEERDAADGIDLAIANRLWVQDGLALSDGYVDTVVGNYGAALATTDFVADPDAARTAVNRWVAGATRDRIAELFPAGSIDVTTRLVLTNAVFLDAAWQFELDPSRTSDEAFTLADGTVVDVPTMHYDERLPAAVGPDWAAVQLRTTAGSCP
jgi:serpin B